MARSAQRPANIVSRNVVQQSTPPNTQMAPSNNTTPATTASRKRIEKLRRDAIYRTFGK